MSIVNIDSLNNSIDGTVEDSQYVDELVNDIVTKCCEGLDNYINYVRDLLSPDNYNLTDEQLDDIIMTIPTLIYFASETQEKLGLRHDVAESRRKISYNEFFVATEGSAGVKKGVAENQTFDEAMVVIIYDRAYNIVKSKINTALELLQSAKKVVSRRMQAVDISRSAPNYDKR